MATAETVPLGPAHAPKEAAITAFNEIEIDLKKELQHMRHDHNKHEPEYFKRVSNLSDKQLTTFSADDVTEVRIGESAYGLHLFSKLKLPESDDCYIMFRTFIAGGAESAKLHCIHTEEIDKPDDKVFKAIFSANDELEWFDE